jgi:hypothetical protein
VAVSAREFPTFCICNIASGRSLDPLREFIGGVELGELDCVMLSRFRDTNVIPESSVSGSDVNGLVLLSFRWASWISPSPSTRFGE